MKKFLSKWITMFVLSLSLAILIIDGTVLNVSISYLLKDLGTDIKHIQTIITTYALIIAAFTITGGRLGDIFGRKKMFILGAIIFAIGAFVASISKNVTTLLIGWSVIEGIGAALMTPATASLILTSYKGKDRAFAFGIWGGIAAAAAAFGPLLGGWLTSNYSWHWAFRINIFIVAFMLLGIPFIKESIAKNISRHIDWMGILLSSSSMALLVYPIIEASKYGWWHIKEPAIFFGQNINIFNMSFVPYMLVFAVIMMMGFIVWEIYIEKLGKTPIVSMKVFKNFQFNSGLVTTIILTLGQAGMLFALPLFLQVVKGLSAYETGKAMLPMSIAAIIIAPISAKLTKKIYPKNLIVFGIFVILIGIYFLLTKVNLETSTNDLILPLVCFGIGIGMVLAQISNLTLSAISSTQAGEVSGIVSTVRMLGQALGSAIIGTIFISALTINISQSLADSKILPTDTKDYLSYEVKNNISEFQYGGIAQKLDGKVSPNTINEIQNMVSESIVKANQKSLVYTFAISILALLAALSLPKIKLNGDK